MTNQTGRINLINTNSNRVVIQNGGNGIKGGHEFTRQFLEANRQYLEQVAFGRGYAELALKRDRLPKFIAHCESHGLEVVGA